MPAIATHQPPAGRSPVGRKALRILPGLALCLAVTAAALASERAEAAAFGATWLEALVLAILVGTAVRTAWTPGPAFTPGIAFSAKLLLEIAVVLLGLSISARLIVAAGPLLILGIAGIVVFAIAASYGIGRALRLPHRMALLVACGNSICGNSAIASTKLRCRVDTSASLARSSWLRWRRWRHSRRSPPTLGGGMARLVMTRR